MSDYISREDAKLAVVDAAQSRENGFQWGETVTFTPSEIIGLIDKIPAADVQPVRWIPVEEQLPETDKLVLVVKSDGDMAVAGLNAALGWLHYWSGCRVRNVTHWMPLPEPPKEEEEE